MKILHVGNTAGSGTSAREFERGQGHDSDVLITKERLNPFQYPCDFLIPIDGKNLHSFKSLIPYIRLALRYDVIHYHYRPVVCCADLLFLRLCGKKIHLHYHGSDIRGKKPPLMHRLAASRTFVSTPDLLEYVPAAKWFPPMLNESDMPRDFRKKYIESREGNPRAPLKILHTPTNPEIKGTEHVTAAIQRLIDEGYEIEYVQPQRCTHNENLHHMANCDVYIDQLVLGFYGTSAVECACMGVPVLCYVSPKYESPFINVDKNTIYDTLKHIIRHPEILKECTERELKFYSQRRDIANEICRLRLENIHTKTDKEPRKNTQMH